MYMPTLARFTARDPVPPNGEPVLLGRVPDALAGYAPSSPYEYANNDPLRYTDASGLQPSDSVCQKKPKCETVKAKRNKSNKCEEGYTPIETVTKGRINQVISECLKNCNKNGTCEQAGESCKMVDDKQDSQDGKSVTTSKKCRCEKM